MATATSQPEIRDQHGKDGPRRGPDPRPREVTIGIAGAAGDGLDKTGDTLAQTAARLGLHVYAYNSYQSLIRGGHNAIHVTASDEPIVSFYPELQVLIALNKETIDLHIKDVVKGGVIVHDGDEVAADDPSYAPHKSRGVIFLSIPLKKLSEAASRSARPRHRASSCKATTRRRRSSRPFRAAAGASSSTCAGRPACR